MNALTSCKLLSDCTESSLQILTHIFYCARLGSMYSAMQQIEPLHGALLHHQGNSMVSMGFATIRSSGSASVTLSGFCTCQIICVEVQCLRPHDDSGAARCQHR